MNSKVVSLAWAKMANCLPLSPPATVNTELGFHLKCLLSLPQPFRKGNQHSLSFSEQSSSIRLPFFPVPPSTPHPVNRQIRSPCLLQVSQITVPQHLCHPCGGPSLRHLLHRQPPNRLPVFLFRPICPPSTQVPACPPHPHPFLKGPQSAQPLPQPRASPASPVASCQ